MAVLRWEILIIIVGFLAQHGLSQTCPNHQFKCPGIFACINHEFRCDAVSLCVDGTDDQDCDGNCAIDEYQCDSGACIPSHMSCNRRIDCAGGDDEEGCSITEGCRYREHQCFPSGACVIIASLCTLDIDVCPAGDIQPVCGGLCGPEEFMCVSGACIAESYRCDGTVDCNTGNDEVGCFPPVDVTACDAHQFACPLFCINIFTVCNGFPNCITDEDETVCSGQCGPNEFQCRSGFCLPERYVCDGHHDCFDFDDDEANCNTTSIPAITTNCTSDGVVASLSGSYVRELLPAGAYQLEMVGDDLKPLNNCFAMINLEADTYDMNFLEGLGHCSANINESDTDIVVTYKVLLADSTAEMIIIRNPQTPVVEFQCSYAKSEVVSLDQPLLALISHVTVDLGKTSSAFTMEMARYTSAFFTMIENERSISIGSPVFIGVRIDVQSGTNLVLQGMICQIKPENRSENIYTVVNEGCAVEDPITPNGNIIYNLIDSRMFGLSFLGFAWAGNRNEEQELWIQCYMNICEKNENNSCEIDCTSQGRVASKRSISDDSESTENQISLGPFILSPELVSDNQLTCDKDELECSYNCGIGMTGNAYCFCPEDHYLDEDGKTCHEINRGIQLLWKVSFFSCIFVLMSFVMLVLVLKIKKTDKDKHSTFDISLK